MSTPPATPAEAQHLPDDPALLKAMLAELLTALRASRRESEQLRTRLDQLLRRLYGPRAERWDPNQLLLFPDAATPEPAPPAPPEPATAPRARGGGHGRQPLPGHLPRERRIYDLAAAERACPCCGRERHVIGQEVSEQLDFVPAALRVIEHVRLTYACAACAAAAPTDTPPGPPASAAPTGAGAAPPVPTIATAAKPPAPIPRGLPGPGLLAHVIVSKYGDHLPLYRLEHIFGRWGVPLSRRTLCDWLPACAALLRPLYDE